MQVTNKVFIVVENVNASVASQSKTGEENSTGRYSRG